MRLSSKLLNGLGVSHGFFGPQPAETIAPILEIQSLTLPKQVHGTRVVHVSRLGHGEADGIWADRAGIGLGIRTADCVPVLLAAPLHGRIAAIHAGWRGTSAGIVERFLQRQAKVGLSPVAWAVALGPAAGGCCYEVGPEVTKALGMPPERRRIDLRRILRDRLHDLGVETIDIVGPCTICAQKDWASYRRQGQGAGRNVAAIAVRESKL